MAPSASFPLKIGYFSTFNGRSVQKVEILLQEHGQLSGQLRPALSAEEI